jgi:hypothetical protein
MALQGSKDVPLKQLGLLFAIEACLDVNDADGKGAEVSDKNQGFASINDDDL